MVDKEVTEATQPGVVPQTKSPMTATDAKLRAMAEAMGISHHQLAHPIFHNYLMGMSAGVRPQLQAQQLQNEAVALALPLAAAAPGVALGALGAAGAAYGAKKLHDYLSKDSIPAPSKKLQPKTDKWALEPADQDHADLGADHMRRHIKGLETDLQNKDAGGGNLQPKNEPELPSDKKKTGNVVDMARKAHGLEDELTSKDYFKKPKTDNSSPINDESGKPPKKKAVKEAVVDKNPDQKTGPRVKGSEPGTKCSNPVPTRDLTDSVKTEGGEEEPVVGKNLSVVGGQPQQLPTSPSSPPQPESGKKKKKAVKESLMDSAVSILSEKRVKYGYFRK